MLKAGLGTSTPDNCTLAALALPQCVLSFECSVALRPPGAKECRGCASDETCTQYWGIKGGRCDREWPELSGWMCWGGEAGGQCRWQSGLGWPNLAERARNVLEGSPRTDLVWPASPHRTEDGPTPCRGTPCRALPSPLPGPVPGTQVNLYWGRSGAQADPSQTMQVRLHNPLELLRRNASKAIFATQGR
jgi:hypothetical protein